MFTNSPPHHGLVVVIMDSVLASISSGRSHDVIIREEWLSIAGYLLLGSRPCCLDLSWSGRGHWMWPVCEELTPSRDSHTVLIRCDRTPVYQARRDLDNAEPHGVT